MPDHTYIPAVHGTRFTSTVSKRHELLPISSRRDHDLLDSRTSVKLRSEPHWRILFEETPISDRRGYDSLLYWCATHAVFSIENPGSWALGTGYQFESRTIIDQPSSTIHTPQAWSPMPAIPDRMIECIGLGHSRMNRIGAVSRVSCAVLEKESLPFRPDLPYCELTWYSGPCIDARVCAQSKTIGPHNLLLLVCILPLARALIADQLADRCPGCQSGRSNAGIGGVVFVPLLIHRDGQGAVNVNNRSRASRI